MRASPGSCQVMMKWFYIGRLSRMAAGISLAPFVDASRERQSGNRNKTEGSKNSLPKRKENKHQNIVTLQHDVSTAMQVQTSRAVVSNLHEQLLQGI